MRFVNKWVAAMMLAIMMVTGTASQVVFAASLGERPLAPGMQGDDVRSMQERLGKLGFNTGNKDGVFGPNTAEALATFQSEHGLTPDTVAGEKTLQQLGVVPSQSEKASLKSGDRQLLAHVIYAEARGESMLGQVAVGAVVLNRLNSPKFAKTLAGVVYEPWAFTCVNDGQINLEPDAQAFTAADRATAGEDPTGGALYYYNPNTASSAWSFSRTVLTRIGSHVFTL